MAERTELQQRLEAEVASVDWEARAPHHARGALLWVSESVPLIMAAMAVALDAVDDVRGFLDRGEVAAVTDEQAKAWAAQPGLQLTFVIVQPYVLVTEAPIAGDAGG